MKGSWTVLFQRARRVGKTYTMAHAAKSLGATLVCHSYSEARRVAKEYDIKTMSVDSPDRLRGTTGPVLFDPDAVASLAGSLEDRLYDAARALEQANREIDTLNRKLAVVREALYVDGAE